MIAYLDASVLLRIIVGAPDPLDEWPLISVGVSSALLEVECLRTLDRMASQCALSKAEALAAREAVYGMLRSMEISEVTRVVLARASQPMPTILGTLDAIHLSTALLWQERKGPDLVFATHDRALARAARASGLRTIGVRGG